MIEATANETPAPVAQTNVGIRSTRHLGSFPRAYSENWLMVGQDGGQSIDLGDRTLFVFSDTLLAWRQPRYAGKYTPAPYKTFLDQRGIFLANSAGIAHGSTLRGALDTLDYFTDADGFPCEILRPDAQEAAEQIRFWPEHGIYIDGAVYLYYLGIQKIDDESVWSFRNLGAGLAILDPETGACQRIRRGGDWRLWPGAGEDFHFGVQTVRAGDEVYVFGSQRHHFDFETIVARVPVDRIADPDAYEYLQSPAPTWSANLDDACDIGGSSSEFSVSYNEHIGAYTMIYVEGHTKWLKMRTADTLTGPYAPAQRIAKVPCQFPDELTYLAFEHPAFRVNGGERVYLSYCQPHFTPNEIVELRFR